jgi:hypothetical protein
MLRSWLADHAPGDDDLLFRTRTGRRPAESNWNRSLKRAARNTGFRALAPYDARHTCATTWLRAGVPLGEVAYRLGHTVETLVGYYVGALHCDDAAANDRIAAALDTHPAVEPPTPRFPSRDHRPETSSREHPANGSETGANEGNDGQPPPSRSPGVSPGRGV